VVRIQKVTMLGDGGRVRRPGVTNQSITEARVLGYLQDVQRVAASPRRGSLHVLDPVSFLMGLEWPQLGRPCYDSLGSIDSYQTGTVGLGRDNPDTGGL
jgi:hypothetical protein